MSRTPAPPFSASAEDNFATLVSEVRALDDVSLMRFFESLERCAKRQRALADRYEGILDMACYAIEAAFAVAPDGTAAPKGAAASRPPE